MSIKSRVHQIRARLAEHSDEEVGPPVMVTLVCNGCGRTETFAADLVTDEDFAQFESLLASWVIATERPLVDYCPDCAPRNGGG